MTITLHWWYIPIVLAAMPILYALLLFWLSKNVRW